MNKSKVTDSKAKKKVTLTVREHTLYENILTLLTLTDDSSVNISHLSAVSGIKGHSLSGVISSLKRKNVITTSNHEIKLTNETE